MSQKSRLRREQLLAIRSARCEIAALREELEAAYGIFNRITDPDLIESCVYELSALHARYNSAIKKAKQLPRPKE